MESRPFNSDAHETSDYDDDSDDSSFLRGAKKAVPVVSAPPALEQRPSTPSLFDVEKTEKPKAETSLFSEKPELGSEKAELDKQDDAAAAAESLDPDETVLVVQEYVAERSEVIDAEIEQSTPDGPAAAAATADKTLLQNIESHMAADGAAGEQAVDGALEAALQQTAQELGLPIQSTELATGAQVTATTEIDAQIPDQGELTQEDDDTNLTSTAQAAIFSAPTNVASANNVSANTQPNQSPGIPQLANPPAPGGYGGAASPPSPPRTPPSGSAPQPGGTGGGANTNALNSASYSFRPSPNVLSATTVEADSQPDRSKSDFQKGLLVGGVAGYLIGKRRGRIKTEKRLAAVTEKLQKEVTTLQDKVLEKEQQVRRLAAEKSINEQAGSPTKTEKTISSSRAETPVATAVVGEISKEAPRVENPAAEAVQQTPITEAAVQKTTEAKQTSEKPPLTAKAVEQLPKNELLDVASTIVIEGTSLKKRFESGEIDEKALRRVVAEHIHTGGHAERQLKAEISHAEQKASPEAVAVKPAIGRRQQSRSSGHAAGQLASHGIWESSMSVSDAQADQPWRADAAIDQHIRSKAPPPPRHAKSLGAGIGGIALILLALAIWYFISH